MSLTVIIIMFRQTRKLQPIGHSICMTASSKAELVGTGLAVTES